MYNTQIKSTGMGKGDKKTRRGKIVLGTYGVRRRRKKGAILSKPSKTAREKETPRKRPVREKSEVKAAAEAREKVVDEKPAPKVQKASREKKEAGETASEKKPKKEKKNEE